MARVRFKTLDELGLEPLTWGASKEKASCHVFARGVWVGTKEVSTGPKGGTNARTVLSEQYSEWCQVGIPAYPVFALLRAIIVLLSPRPDVQTIVIHQLKAKLDRLCEEFPLPPDHPAVTELVEDTPKAATNQ